MRILSFLILTFFACKSQAQFKQTPPRALKPGEVAVTGPGNYGVPGTTYVLMNDVSSPRSAIFLGKDVVLDLNGYTLRFADGDYQNMANSGFEEGAVGWDLSRAPGAQVVGTDTVHVFVGERLLRMRKGDEVRSPYVELPLSNRSYFAMCGVTGFDWNDMKADVRNQMKISLYVEDEQGREVKVTTEYRDTTMVSSPVENRQPRLGGGFVYAHLQGLPAGKYRVRIKAETDCLIDEVDIRPAMDVGIGIVDKTYARGHYDDLYNGRLAAFYDYTDDRKKGTALPGIPRAQGRGTVVIRNGTIVNAAKGVLSWGVQSTAEDVRVVLDNVSIVTSGINTIAVDVPQATITNCRFEVDNPFIINRHGSSFYAVDLRGRAPSEVSYSEFIGGQGCLVFKGKRTTVHHNRFRNRQMVTNHYSIMAMGDSSLIHDNYIVPEVGSGIEIYKHKYIEIFNNYIAITTSPPTCEYGHDTYSTNAIRIADYLAPPGSPSGCYGNRVYNNRIEVTAEPRAGVESYQPVSWAVFYSASGGDNEIFGNDIVIRKTDLTSKTNTSAFYIGGGNHGYGGKFYNNRITTNVPAAWIGTPYGGAARSKFVNNVIIRDETAGDDFAVFRMGGYSAKTAALEIEFRSNEIIGAPFRIDATDHPHTYSVYWTLEVNVVDRKQNAKTGVLVQILDKNNKSVFSGTTDDKGRIEVELLESTQTETGRVDSSTYTVIVGKKKHSVTLTKNTSLTVTQ